MRRTLLEWMCVLLPTSAGIALARTAARFQAKLHPLQVNLNKRFAQGLSFHASYTYPRALGYTGNNGLLLNPFNLRSNYGPLDYDRTHISEHQPFMGAAFRPPRHKPDGDDIRRLAA